MGCHRFDASVGDSNSQAAAEATRRTPNKKIPAPFHVVLDAGLLLSVES